MGKNTSSRVRFPVGACVPTKNLSRLDVKRLEVAMVKEGFRLVKRGPLDYLSYDYLGVNHYGDIMYYSNPSSYLPIGSKTDGRNVLHSTFVEDYTSNITEVVLCSHTK